MARKKSVQSVDRAKAAIGFKRAKELYDSAVEATNAERWTAIGPIAIMASIALADAILVHEKELRSTSPNHLDVTDLLLEECAQVEGVKEAVNHLRRILLQKNAVQYEMRVFLEKDARAMRQQLDRFLSGPSNTGQAPWKLEGMIAGIRRMDCGKVDADGYV